MISCTAVNESMIMRSHSQIGYKMVLQNRDGQKSKIKLKSTTKPNKGLGYLLASTGTQAPEFKQRLQQTKEKVAKISRAILKQHEA